MDLGEIEWCGVNWISLAQNWDNWRALVNAVMKFRFPNMLGELCSGFTSGGLSSSAQLYRVN
jgi:hypothetical protein